MKSTLKFKHTLNSEPKHLRKTYNLNAEGVQNGTHCNTAWTVNKIPNLLHNFKINSLLKCA